MIGQPTLPLLEQRRLGRRRIGAVSQPRTDVQRAHDAVGQFGVESLPGLDGVEHDVEPGIGGLPQMVGTKPAITGMTGVGIDPDREKRFAVEPRGSEFCDQRVPQRSSHAELPDERVAAEAAAIGDRDRDAMRALGKRTGR